MSTTNDPLDKVAFYVDSTNQLNSDPIWMAPEKVVTFGDLRIVLEMARTCHQITEYLRALIAWEDEAARQPSLPWPPRPTSSLPPGLQDALQGWHDAGDSQIRTWLDTV